MGMALLFPNLRTAVLHLNLPRIIRSNKNTNTTQHEL
jgi:hypothetical protein